MWTFVIKAALFVGSIAYKELTKPEIKDDKITPSKDTSDFPRDAIGSGITVIFGYAYVKDACSVYYKIGTITENQQLVEQNTFSDDEYQVVSYNYHCTIQDIICLSNIDSIEYIYVNNAPCRNDWDGSSTYYGWSANTTNILIAKFATQSTGYVYTSPFGAIQNTYGYIDLEFGGATQTKNTHLNTAAQQGAGDIPAYRGVVQVVKKDIFIGEGTTNSPTPVPWQYVVKRINIQHDGTTQWNSTKAHVAYGLNPIHIIRELIISDVIGAGLSDTYIDTTSFNAAADTCYTDGVGLGFSYNDTNGTVRELIGRVMDYIPGFFYFDMSDFKFKIKLFQEDYTYATLDEITTSDAIQIDDIKKPDVTEVVNDVTVKYTDRFNFEETTAKYSDLTSIQQIGINPQIINLPWLYSGDYAAKMAAQICIMSVAQLSSCIIVGSLSLNQYNTGDVFKLTDERYGWDGIVVRVVEKHRDPVNSERITLSVIEDFFGIGQGSFGTGNNEITDSTLVNVSDPVVLELPYFLMRVIYVINPDNVLGESKSHTFMFCGKPAVSYTGYGAHYKLSTDTNYTDFSNVNRFINTRTLGADIGLTDTEITTAEGDYAIEAITFIMINNEIMYHVIGSPGTGVQTVRRGVQDTIPQEHSSGDTIYFFTEKYEVINAELAFGSTYNHKMTSQSISGAQSVSDATAYNVTIANRSIRPYPPGKIQVNSDDYTNSGIFWIDASGGSVITWAGRDRTLEYELWIAQTSSEAFEEDGVVYRVEIWTEDGLTVKRTSNLINANTYDYTTTFENTDFGSLSDKLMKIIAKRMKDTSPYVSTNTDATSSIVASTKTITWKGQDLTDKIEVGYTILLITTSNTGDFTVATIELSGSDTVITTVEALTDETLSGTDETLSTPIYWNSTYEWELYIKRLLSPAFYLLQLDRVLFEVTDQAYVADSWYYEKNSAPSGDPVAEPSDPTISSTEAGTITNIYDDTYASVPKSVGYDVWIKIIYVIGGKVSPILSYQS